MPGTVVKFKPCRGYTKPGGRLGMVIEGTLIAIETPENQIWFTSDSSDPINSDWCMLCFKNVENNSIIKYAVVKFAQ